MTKYRRKAKRLERLYNQGRRRRRR